jgi:hypothetical protein
VLLYIIDSEEQMMRKFRDNVWTSGDGYWSGVSKQVSVTGIDIAYLNREENFAELRIYFDRRTWITERHGLIYTDKGFLKEFRDALVAAGYTVSAAKDVEYSEQGMQADDYVSCDVGKKFLTEWFKGEAA